MLGQILRLLLQAKSLVISALKLYPRYVCDRLQIDIVLWGDSAYTLPNITV